MAILRLQGGSALSGFRLEKLNASLDAAGLAWRVAAARHVHFVDVADDTTEAERAVVERLLRYGPEPPPLELCVEPTRLVVPRIGTVSPWSSKATDIARQCGLGFVRRIERGTLYHLRGSGDLEPALPLVHDRMTESVLSSLEAADALFEHVAPRPLALVDVLGKGRQELREGGGWPSLEVSDSDTELRLCAELPGLTEQDIDVSVTGDVLTITGEKKESREQEEKGVLISERRYGSFRRQIPLPAEIDRQAITAQFKNGILDVTLAKDENVPARSRKIEIGKG